MAFNSSVAGRYAEQRRKTGERKKESNKVVYLRHACNEVAYTVTKLKSLRDILKIGMMDNKCRGEKSFAR
ncbi:hypothetical protein D0T49_00850 [Paludibacter sp. 221]|nr:hypothetical protein [Paludibacter sp. 221]